MAVGVLSAFPLAILLERLTTGLRNRVGERMVATLSWTAAGAAIACFAFGLRPLAGVLGLLALLLLPTAMRVPPLPEMRGHLADAK
jgi:hypothetical protein